MIYNSSTGSTDILVWQSVEITTPPTKTTYNLGEAFDPAGMVVSLVFADGTRIATNAYTVSPATLTLETTAVTLTVSFGGGTKTVTQAVTVQEKKSMSYSGAHITKEITVNGMTYTQYTITGSGTLTVEGTYENVAVWLCGGGANGAKGGSSGGGLGGGGAFCAQYDSQSLSGTYAIAVASAGGNSTITRSSETVFSANGASGANGGTGGGGTSSNGGTGDGVTKYPFGDSTIFQCHCAGGGGGSGEYNIRYDPDEYTTYSNCAYAGNGGSNGAAGGKGWSPTVYQSRNAPGGSVGGGTGGGKSAGSAATFYGSGGGGGGTDGQDNYSYPYYGKNTYYNGGAGYQGVVYIRVPA